MDLMSLLAQEVINEMKRKSNLNENPDEIIGLEFHGIITDIGDDYVDAEIAKKVRIPINSREAKMLKRVARRNQRAPSDINNNEFADTNDESYQDNEDMIRKEAETRTHCDADEKDCCEADNEKTPQDEKVEEEDVDEEEEDSSTDEDEYEDNGNTFNNDENEEDEEED